MTPILRRCAFTKILLPREQMIRLVRTKDGMLHRDEKNMLKGRSVHIAQTENAISQLKNPKKIPYLAHLLKIPVEVVKNFLSF